MMNQQQTILDDYLNHAQLLSIRGETGEEVIPELLAIISDGLNQAFGQRQLLEFFKAERAFFKGQYKLALMHYLAAKEIPSIRFYCYRASAYLSLQYNRKEQALQFAERAAAIQPQDPLTQKVLSQLDQPTNIQQTAETTELNDRIALADEEIADLTSLFQEEEEPPYLNPVTIMEPTMDADTNTHATNNESSTEELTTTSTSTTHTTTTDTADPTSGTTTPYSETTLNTSADLDMATTPMDELSQLVASDYATTESTETSNYVTTDLGISTATTETLEQRVKAFQQAETEVITQYLNDARTTSTEDCFYVLHGWNTTETTSTSTTTLLNANLLTEETRKSTGGFFLRWNGTGIAINPGQNFLNNFHNQGLLLSDIDCVIVTQPNTETCADIKALYDLNFKLNTAATELHVINYYLHPQLYQQVAPMLKPNFKQERKTIHSMELYVDSPDVEKIDLNSEITMRYFPTASSETTTMMHPTETRNTNTTNSMGITFELSSNADMTSTTKVGYVSGTTWSPMLAHNLENCDLLITGFENTDSNDYNKLKYSSEGLGYFGTSSLVEEVQPRLLLCCEFGGREGDIRMETVRKLRNESTTNTTMLPGDTGLNVNLNTLQVQSTSDQTLLDADQVCVIKTQDAFGKLQYISPNCYL